MRNQEPQTSGPLSNVRVLDLSRVLAGPWAGQIFADLGADVIHVERPGVGDDTRGYGPPFLKDRNGQDTREAGYYLAVNRGKRSITIDLAKREGQRLVRKLAARSDILLENYKVGTLTRFGLGYDDLRSVNPKLIYCSITGFGQDGPRSDQAAYDFMIQAMGGLMSVTGERDGRPGAGPQKVGVPIVDYMTGMYTAVAALAALARREASGEGDYIDIGMLDVQVSMLANQAMNFLVSGKTPKRNGNLHPNIQPQDVFQCSDGAIAIAVGNDGQFVKFCEVLGEPGWSEDERFAKNAARVRNFAALDPMIAAKLKQKARKHWVDLFAAAGVPAGSINLIPEVFDDPQVRHRGMRVDIPHPLSGTVPQVASPMRFKRATLTYERAPPLLGEHTLEVLRELGLDDAELNALRASGAI